MAAIDGYWRAAGMEGRYPVGREAVKDSIEGFNVRVLELGAVSQGGTEKD